MVFSNRSRRVVLCLATAALSLQCGDDGHSASDVAVAPELPTTGACGGFAAPPSSVKATPAFGDLTFELPTRMVRSRGTSSAFYVVQQNGIIQRVAGTGNDARSTLFADLRSRVAYPLDTQEGGLFSLAFSPHFDTDNDVFLSYTAYGTAPRFRRVVTRMKSWDGGLTLDPTTESTVLDMDREFGGHNGGQILFGPDGYLYVGLGDGHYGDPDGNAQNRHVLLGKLLRLDVSTRPYSIPPDNPFVDGSARPEIWALGFRNPFSFSFDRENGDLWLGDVGHVNWEEIDRVTKGANYGWRVREGSHCFEAETCVDPTLTDPVYEYSHLVGEAVTGGYVYRGRAIPELVGHYVFGDYVFGTLSVLENDAVTNKPVARRLLNTFASVPSITEDEDGELFFIDYFAGKVFKLGPADGATSEAMPTRLSETGCVDRADVTKPNAGVIPYDVKVSFWSDGADKDRAFALPSGTQITTNPDGTWTFPDGSVAIKTFSLQGRRVETRLLVNHGFLGWSGYSYEWNEAQTDAFLLEDRKVTSIGGHDWLYPSRTECTFCHTNAAGRVLGLQAMQMNRTVRDPDGTEVNQLTRLSDLGIFTAPVDPASTPQLFAPSDATAPLGQRARAWLHVNCSQCHQPQAPGQGPADLRIDAPDPHLCNVVPGAGDLRIPGARLVLPGSPSQSLLYIRATTRGPNQMPPLGSSLVDPEGNALLHEWITSGAACP